jgi:5'-nucleotidase
VSIKTVLFDLDDTLFDNLYASRCALLAIQQMHPALARLPIDRFERDYWTLVEELWHVVLRGEMTVEDSRVYRLRTLIKQYGDTCDEQDGQALALRYRESYQLSRQPVAGVVPLLEYLKPRVRVGIVTNNFVAEQEDKLRYCGIDHLIDFMVTSEEVGAPKPSPVIYNAAIQLAGCDTSEIVMVGDNWNADIVGAHALGIRSVWLNRAGLPCPDAAITTEIRAFEPLADMLRAIGFLTE